MSDAQHEVIVLTVSELAGTILEMEYKMDQGIVKQGTDHFIRIGLKDDLFFKQKTNQQDPVKAGLNEML